MRFGQKLLLHRAKQLAKRYIYWKQGWKVTTAIFVVVFAAALTGYTVLHVSADSATLVPNGDVTAGWPATGGTNDASCAGGTHCDFVDEGTTDKTTDYVTTSGSTAGSEVEEYALSSVTNIKTASQVVARIYIQDTSIGGGTTDTLTLNLRVNGALQTAKTCTPTASWSACTATFSGSWVQADVDSMQLYVQRNKLGSGNPSSQADTIVLANAYATLTYVPNLQVSQSAYRWFTNQDASAMITFANAYGGSGGDQGNDVISTSDGGYATTGSVYAGSNSYDMSIIKYSSSGSVVWSSSWGSTGTDEGNSLVQTSDGGFVVTGSTTESGNLYLVLIKFDSSGSVVWSNRLSASSSGQSIVLTADGFVVTGYVSNGVGNDDVLLIKYDTSGSIQWQTSWGGTGTDRGEAVVQTLDGGFVAAGSTSSYGSGSGDTDAFITKFDASGNFSWYKTWGGSNSESANSIAQTSDGNLVITGYSTTYKTGTSATADMFVAKYNSSGTLQWNKTWGGSQNDYGSKVVLTKDNQIVVVGYTASFGSGLNDLFLVQYDTSGNLVWNKTWGGSQNDYGYSLALTPDDGFIATGETASSGATNDIFLTKLNDTGDMANCSTLCSNPTASTSTPTVVTTPPASTITPITLSKVLPAGTAAAFTVTTTNAVTLNPPASAIAVGAGLAAQDTAVTVPDEGTIFRLRMDLHISGSQVTANQLQLKLQYAPKASSATCSVVPTGNFNDVTATSAVSYADNPLASNGMKPQADAVNDPKHGTDTNVPQTYLEKGASTFSNAQTISIAQDGMWDFALQTYHALQNTSYCLRVVQAGDTILDGYSVYPEIITPAATFSQASYRWYNPAPPGGPMTFAKAYGGSGNDVGNSVVQTTDGGYVVTGYTTSNGSAGEEDMLLSKYDSSGNLSWSKTWGGSKNDVGNSVVQTTDGYVVTGNTGSYGGTDVNRDILLVKFDLNGNLLWSKTWDGGSNSDDVGNSVVQTTDGSYVVTGSTLGTYQNIFLVKFDANGTTTWSKIMASGVSQQGNALIQTTDGYVVTGNTNTGFSDLVIAKFDTTGNPLWSKTWDGGNNDVGQSLVQATDGSYVVTGETVGFGGGGSTSSRMFLAKFDATNGNISWFKTWGSATNNAGYSIIRTTDGGYAVTGSTDGLFLAKFDANGNNSWTKTVNIDGQYMSVIQTSDGGYAASGYFHSSGNDDVLLFKFDSTGAIAGCSAPVCNTPTITTTPQSVTVSAQSFTASSPVLTTTPQSVISGTAQFITTVIYSNTIDTGNPLAPQNTPLDLPNLAPLNLRVALRVDTSGVPMNTLSFKLQFARRLGAASCQAVSSGDFNDVTTSTAIAYYDDSSHSTGQPITDSPNDPSDGNRTMLSQSYQESNPFSNGVSDIFAGQDGIWQFALYINNTTLKSTDFCLRVATSTGTSLSALNVPEVAYAPLMQQLMRGGNWFSRAGAKQNISL
jgi:uncharacterized delta-60 repeat protein